MENSFRIIYALCIIFLRFPLYYLVPIEHISYTSVINNDTSLCNNPIKEFLCKSEFTKDCTKLNYPRDIDKLTLEYESIETFLCLGMHDAVYKVCQYIQNETWTGTFSKKEDLDFSIQNFTGYKPNGESLSPNSMRSQENFCERLREFTPMYGKVQPALEKLVESLKIPVKCNKVCFDLNDRLNPLCAVLAWVNQIDQTVKKNAITKSNKATDNSSNISKLKEYPVKHVKEVNTHNDEQPVDIVNPKYLKDTKIDNTDKQNNPKQEINVNNSQSPSNFANNGIISHNQQNSTIKSTSTTNKSISQANPSNPVKQPDTQHVENHNNNNKLTSVAISEQQLPPKVGSDVAQQVDSKAALNVAAKVDSKEAANVDSNVDLKDDNVKNNKNVNNKTVISSVEVKSTTLSENTQDNIAEDNAADNPNPDDFTSRLDDEPLSNSFLDTLSQPVDTDNRNENIPDTSGQREIDSFHVIKDDEESHFFTYFAIITLGFIASYIGYHNKQKILAIVLEGRRSKNNRGRRRPSTANYRKLDCTLEEAVTSQCNANVTHVIY